MLITLGEKQYLVTAKFKHWRDFQREVTRVTREREGAEGAEAAEASDQVLELGICYLNEHLKAVHVKGEDGAMQEDAEWVKAVAEAVERRQAWVLERDETRDRQGPEPPGPAEEYLEPDEALALIGQVANPTETPFA
jgi:hypothetical protein